MTDATFTGIELVQTDTALNTEHAIGLSRLPGRKQVSLYLREGAVITPVAFFREDDHAKQVVAWLDALMGGKL